MKVTVKTSAKELLTVQNELSSLLSQKGIKLAIVVNKNLTTLKGILQPILDSYRQQYDSIEKLKEYQSALNELYQTYGKKDENGNLVSKTVNGKTVIEIENIEQYKAAEEKLKSEYSTTIQQIEKLTADYNEILSQENEVELEQIDSSTLSDNLTGEDLMTLITHNIVV